MLRGIRCLLLDHINIMQLALEGWRVYSIERGYSLCDCGSEKLCRFCRHFSCKFQTWQITDAESSQARELLWSRRKSEVHIGNLQF